MKALALLAALLLPIPAAAQIRTGRALRASLPSVPSPPLVARVLDIDFDGCPDLLIGCRALVLVWRNGGEADFEDRTALGWPADGGGARELWAADIDSDSAVEVLAQSADGSRLRWFDTAGDGRFRRTTRGLSGPATDVVLGDLDGDTHPDLLVARGRDWSPRLRLGDGRGGFTVADDKLPELLDGSVAFAFARGGFTGAVEPELIVAGPGAEHGDRLQLLRLVGPGDAQRLRVEKPPTEQPPPGTAAAVAPRGLLPIDLDADGDLDLLVRGADGGLQVLERTADSGAWRPAGERWLPAGLPPVAEVAPLWLRRERDAGARDRLVMLLVTRDGACLLLHREDGQCFQADASLLPGVAADARGAVRPVIADLDGDGCQDVVLVGPERGVELWLARRRRNGEEAAFVLAALAAPR